VAVRAKAKRTESEWKDAARRLLTRKGYAEMRITDIATEAGKAVGSFYRYFDDKDALLRSLVDDFRAELRSRVVEQVGHQHALRSEDDIRHHVAAYWQTYREHLPEMVGLFQASMLNDAFRRLHAELRDHQVAMWEHHLRGAEADGADRSEAHGLALAIVCMLEYFCYTWLTEQSGRVGDAEVIGRLSRLLATGLLASEKGRGENAG
jgi:AcrR family transcriptional regulator